MTSTVCAFIDDSKIVINPLMCIICQKRRRCKDKLSTLTEEGKCALLKFSAIRKSLLDSVYPIAIERIENVLKGDNDTSLVYHRECYSTFANSDRIERNKKKSDPLDIKCTALPSQYTTRNRTRDVEINKCIICQEETKESLRQVKTKAMEETLRNLSNYDQHLFIRTGMDCLISSEVKYHSLCIIKAERARKKAQNMNDRDYNNIVPMIQLCEELKVSSSLGHVLKLTDVFERYKILARLASLEIPKSFESRLASFKQSLKMYVKECYFFFRPLDKTSTERQTLLLPQNCLAKIAADAALGEAEKEFPIPRHNFDEDFRTVVHAAQIIRAQLRDSPGHSGLRVSEEEAVAVIPKSLHLFLNVLIGADESPYINSEENDGKCKVEEEKEDDNVDDEEEEDDEEGLDSNDGNSEKMHENLRSKELSIGQDIVYAVSAGKKLTPKHIGLALAVHQQTRSRKLVNLLHSAGHCMSYKQVLQADKTLANVTLKSLDNATGAVIPPNFKVSAHNSSNGSVLHLTADNIDILTDTLDGKKSFHATQMVAFQRGGTSTDEILRTLKLDRNSTLKVPDVLNDLLPLTAPKIRPEPHFSKAVQPEWFRASAAGDMKDLPITVKESRLQDVAFGLSRINDTVKPGWTEINKKSSSSQSEISAVGYMPLILNPAHEMTTLNTVVQRCIAVANKLGKRHVVLTTDQALYCKLLELKWHSEEVQNRVILRMGGLHIAMNFLKVIGKHMGGSGLTEMWLESGLMGEGSISKVLDGKAYGKGLRAHKITLQAALRILAPQIISFFEEHGIDCKAYMLVSENHVQLKDFLHNENCLELLSKFVKEKSKEHTNFEYWWSYMDMVMTLLMFTRGIRDGKWHTYRDALTEMLPYIALYDHGNYFRSLTAYICDMNQLPAEVEQEFVNGDFTVLRTPQKFSQVDPDHAQEWVVGISKGAGGLVGITQAPSTVQRWALSFHWRGEITQQTFAMYGQGLMNVCYGEKKGQRKRDNSDEDALLKVMQSFNLMETVSHSSFICNIATKDRATKEIQESLLGAKKRGLDLVINFVNQRLILKDSLGRPIKSYYASIPKNSALTLTDLFAVKSCNKGKNKVVEADRDVLRRLILAYEAGRQIDLASILKHELFPVPLSLAETDGTLRFSEKASVLKLVTEDVECPNSIEIDQKTSQLIIDGQALVNIIGKPANATNFGDLASIFIDRIVYLGKSYSRVDILFDRYRPMSIKSGTRSKRTKGAAPVRRDITNGSVPLPKDWKNFLALAENKADLARFLSEAILKHCFISVEVVVSGGFKFQEDVRSTKQESDVSSLSATHEEADTRVILHAIHSDADNIVVMARDTDICLLLIHHYEKMTASKLWMMSGTAKERKYIPVHEICTILQNGQKNNILAFHALTGCDSTSHLTTISKKSAWKSFNGTACQLLDGLGHSPLSPSSLANAEKFLVQLYKVGKDVCSGDEARHKLFGIVKKPEALPPTSDALRLHILRCHYQVNIWENAHNSKPEQLDPKLCGWTIQDSKLTPVLTTLEPVPKACTDVLSCNCSGSCLNNICTCQKNGLICTKLCHRNHVCLNYNS